MSKRTYKVWCPDYGSEEDDYVAVTASDPQTAAEKWAAHRDHSSADYLIVGGQDVEVHVRVDGDLLKYRVFGEQVAHYRAQMIHAP
jgi:hypothetical protein